MKLHEIETWATVPPTGIGGSFWVIVRITTDNGIEGIGECYGIPVSGDIACPLANSSDEGLHYINGDYTMLIGRYPVGQWVGLEVAQQLGADGISMASCTLVDETGPFGGLNEELLDFGVRDVISE